MSFIHTFWTDHLSREVHTNWLSNNKLLALKKNRFLVGKKKIIYTGPLFKVYLGHIIVGSNAFVFL